MTSIIASKLNMTRQPVAIYRSKTCPENALQFREGVWGCVIALLNAASQGRTAAFHRSTVVCKGGQAGLGLHPFETGVIEYFLSVCGKEPRPGEHYKKTPELALEYIHGLPAVESPDYVVFQPLGQVEGVEPEAVVFLVNADQLSGLVTLANYDQHTQDNVQLRFASGCAQSILYGLHGQETSSNCCYIGLTDPSARKCIDKDLLSFTIPYHRYVEMEANAPGSFLDTDTWATICQRIPREE